MKHFYVPLLLLMAIYNSHAQPTAKDHYSKLDLFTAETEFSKIAGTKGFKAANFMYAADSAIVFRPKEIKALKWAATQPDSTFGIRWYPSFIDISAAGDLGYAIGPFENHYDPKDTSKYILGQFATVWQRQDDGTLKFIMDFGTSQLPRSFRLAIEPVYKAGPEKTYTNKKTGSSAIALNEILKTEHVFNETCKSKGDITAYKLFADTGIRFFYQREFYVSGMDAVLSILKTQDGNHEWSVKKINASGNMVHLYGTHKYHSNDKEQEGCFMRVWKKQDNGKWKIVLQVRNIP